MKLGKEAGDLEGWEYVFFDGFKDVYAKKGYETQFIGKYSKFGIFDNMVGKEKIRIANIWRNNHN